MLKAYAVALALTTTAPVSDNQDGVKDTPLQKQESTETEAMKSDRKWKPAGGPVKKII